MQKNYSLSLSEIVDNDMPIRCGMCNSEQIAEFALIENNVINFICSSCAEDIASNGIALGDPVSKGPVISIYITRAESKL